MNIRDQLTPDQYKLVFNTPMAAVTYVASASGGGFDMIKEFASASKFMAEEAGQEGDSGYGELVDSLLADMRGMSKDEAKKLEIEYDKPKDAASLRNQAKQAVAEGWAAVANLPGSDGFAKWSLEVSRTAALTKTGGHFGIGNKSVIDEQEQVALEELASLMGGKDA